MVRAAVGRPENPDPATQAALPMQTGLRLHTGKLHNFVVTGPGSGRSRLPNPAVPLLLAYQATLTMVVPVTPAPGASAER